MEFYDINKDAKVYPGEYLLYTPKNTIVVCGAYLSDAQKIKALSDGRLIEDSVQNFRKIRLNKEDRRKSRQTRCKGCSQQ
tara:strand:+ start:20837 stop:21076 length:240 start_codon:yes stop_codon:yes gene_type:complete